MLICGLKLTHDGAIALLDDDDLKFSVEIEKLDNNPRHSRIDDLRLIPDVLARFGYSVADVDTFVVDGWVGAEQAEIPVGDQGVPIKVRAAGYHEDNTRYGALDPFVTGSLEIGGVVKPYVSYSHTAGHVAAAYFTSDFARRRESSFVLVWDGGMTPRLYFADPVASIVEYGGSLFPAVGHIYAAAAQHFGPFRKPADVKVDLTVAGKMMAYVALGKPDTQVRKILQSAFDGVFNGEKQLLDDGSGIGIETDRPEPLLWLAPLEEFYTRVKTDVAALGIADADVLATVHEFCGELLTSALVDRVIAWKGKGEWNLCFSGGCALNIKWNSDLRAKELFRDVWVPPFPNDAGAAIGTAVCHRAQMSGFGPLNWHVRSGPAVRPSELPSDGASAAWRVRTCSAKDIADLLFRTGQPVVFLNGRAELGPRALGGRSIISPATSPAMKDLLNELKGRESYRPVAPVCLVDRAPEVFEPGTPDPYMLFEHRVRQDWLDRIPAVVHLDGTARLQTVSPEHDDVLHEVLTEYHRLSGVPVLCNTSANLNGSGFFPDVASVIEWGRVNYVWSDGELYYREP
ncbi:carbamoyltransferase N-terminal domain-containing protein [Streptomyces angustmyceticus]|uniref:Carbamoyltransferase n=1 Tax=Streptomyces angustmyceticus TaxID=285578 RepID=A0A5J4LKN3_9ACTN|nr:carbamoyltransferase N-terminal domain-containing protein [Streptomyces angustmyceticus]UAL71002.1 nodulation protein U [Streptomyces angustmyceticus]GES32572.1 carbamoyltransferase [Streptomyces angustmyceticus]